MDLHVFHIWRCPDGAEKCLSVCRLSFPALQSGVLFSSAECRVDPHFTRSAYDAFSHSPSCSSLEPEGDAAFSNQDTNVPADAIISLALVFNLGIISRFSANLVMRRSALVDTILSSCDLENLRFQTKAGNTTSPVVISWSDWGPQCTCWRAHEGYEWITNVSGQRQVFTHRGAGGGSPVLILRDFDRSAVAHAKERFPGDGEDGTHIVQTMPGSLRVTIVDDPITVHTRCFSEPFTATGMPYVEYAFENGTDWGAVSIDGDRIISVLVCSLAHAFVRNHLLIKLYASGYCDGRSQISPASNAA